MEHRQPGETHGMEPRRRMRISEIIVVEGIHDKQAVERVCDADIWVLGGDRIARALVTELKRAARLRGVILLTDPDGPGERIRRRLENELPHCNCKHAFVPKRDATGEGAVGIEHAPDEAILTALRQARPTVDTTAVGPAEFTLEDLVSAGLANGPKAALRRQQVGEKVGIGYGNAKAFLHKLNALGVKRAEWEQALSAMTSTGDDGQEAPHL